MTVADLSRADALGVGAAGFAVAAAGVITDTVGERVGITAPGQEVWRGLSREGFVAAARWQGRAVEVAGRALTDAGAALAEYTQVLDAARRDALAAQQLTDRGRRRYEWARHAWTVAAAAGDTATASDAVAAARTGVQEHHNGTAAQEQALTRARDAADDVIARLRAATEVTRSAGEATNTLTADDGWTLADLLLAPVTIPTGLINGALIEPARALIGLGTTIATDPELQRQILTAIDGGPLEWQLRATITATSFGIDHGEQLVDAATTGGIDAAIDEATDDTTKAARLAADVTGITDLATGLRHGDLYRAATGAGAITDLLLGTHGAGTATRTANAAEIAAETLGRGTDDIATTGLRDLTDDTLDLHLDTDPPGGIHRPPGGDESEIVHVRTGATATADQLALGHPDDGGFRLADLLRRPGRLWTPDPPIGTDTTSSGLHVPAGYLHDIAPDDPVLDLVVGAGRDHRRLASPRYVTTSEDPFSGIVRIVKSDGSHGSGFVVGVDEARRRTTIVTANHVLFDKKLVPGIGLPYEVATVSYPRAGPAQFEVISATTPVLHHSVDSPSWLPRGSTGAFDGFAGDLAVLHLASTPPPGTFVFPLDGTAPLLTPGNRVHVAGYPSNAEWWNSADAYPRRRGLLYDRGYHVAWTPSSSDRFLPGVDLFSTYGNAGLSGGPLWSVGQDRGIQLVGVHVASVKGNPGQLPPDVRWEWMQSYDDLVTPVGPLSDPATHGGNAISPRLIPGVWAWLQDQARYGP
ncbi:MAG: hypothetical protein ACRCYR_20525 [Phycicoccus sp.]